MSVQTTRYITRGEAEALARRIWLQQWNFTQMWDEKLEEFIIEDYYNYTIIEDDGENLEQKIYMPG